ncbi:MAG: hypothetical protein ABI597_10570 [Gammaproteobacteria bacterium]
MTNNSSIHQKKFPFIKRTIDIDQNSNKIIISNKSPFKSNQVEIAIDNISENSEKITKKSIGWFLTAFILTGYFIVCLSTWFWNPPKSYDDITLYIIGQSLLLLGTGYLWLKFFNESYNLTLYSDKFTNQISFALYTNNPDKETFSKFIEKLHNAINNTNQRKTINEILASIPTHILVDEFSSSYISELVRREVDISSMMKFITKKVSVLKK